MSELVQKLKKRPIFTLVAYFILYDICFMALEQMHRQYHIVHCALDDLIPFTRFAVLPYVLWFGWVPVMIFLFLYHSREEFWSLFGTIAAGTASSLVLYALVPTAQNLRQPLVGNDPLTGLVRMIYTVDTPTNVCPSLHVFVTVAILLSIYDSEWVRSRRFKIVNTVIAIAICLSTVLINQHSVVDVVCGIALAIYLHEVICCGSSLLPTGEQLRRKRFMRRSSH